MRDGSFEWDEAKNSKNIAKHGIDFAVARQIFFDPLMTDVDDRDDYGETREFSLGVTDGLLILAVVHTDRHGRVRIISARRASREESKRYEEAIRSSFDHRRTHGNA